MFFGICFSEFSPEEVLCAVEGDTLDEVIANFHAEDIDFDDSNDSTNPVGVTDANGSRFGDCARFEEAGAARRRRPHVVRASKVGATQRSA